MKFCERLAIIMPSRFSSATCLNASTRIRTWLLLRLSKWFFFHCRCMRFSVTHFDWRKTLDDGVGSAFKTSPRGCVTVVFEILMARGKRRLNRKIKKKSFQYNLHTENKHLREQKYIFRRVRSVLNPKAATYGSYGIVS